MNSADWFSLAMQLMYSSQGLIYIPCNLRKVCNGMRLWRLPLASQNVEKTLHWIRPNFM